MILQLGVSPGLFFSHCPLTFHSLNSWGIRVTGKFRPTGSQTSSFYYIHYTHTFPPNPPHTKSPKIEVVASLFLYLPPVSCLWATRESLKIHRSTQRSQKGTKHKVNIWIIPNIDHGACRIQNKLKTDILALLPWLAALFFLHHLCSCPSARLHPFTCLSITNPSIPTSNASLHPW